MSLNPQYYRDLLRPAFGGKRFLLVGSQSLAGLASLGRELTSLGADAPFLLASQLGRDALPAGIDAAFASLDLPRAATPILSIRQYEERVLSLPDPIVRAIDRWDPERRARALCRFTLAPVKQVAGRPRYADRAAEWAELEDKTLVPAFFDAIGVRRGPLAVVRADPDSLRGAALRVDRGQGTVWSGDARDGVNGGSTHVRWIRCDASASEAEVFFGRSCGRVRVQPFFEGIPCSVHGFVVADGVAIFRPVETLTFRRPSGGQFVYAGSNTFWDPNSKDREEIRSVARTVGKALHSLLGYRGVFTLDGVLAEEGFIPTEINPRLGAAFDLLQGDAELPLTALALAAQHGERLDFRPAELERLVLEAADARRSCRGWLGVSGGPAERERRPVVEERGEFRAARAEEQPHAVASFEPASHGGFASVFPERERTLEGPSLAPRIALGYAFIERELGAGIGPLVPAEPVR